MTYLNLNYIHQLRFSINSDEPTNYLNKFKTLKHKIENENNKHFSFQIKETCKLEVNKTLPILDRIEGGLGGDNNLLNKQIRYRSNYGNIDNDIIIYVYNSEHEHEKWCYKELDDIILSFIKVCNIGNECTNGCIELLLNDDDNYLSDEDY